MKILFVSSGNESSSVSNLALSQAESLIRQNVNVDLYCIKGKGVTGYLKNIFPLQTTIRSNQYDIIHAHYGLSGFVALCAKDKKTKLVISFMGNDILGDHAKNGKSTFYGSIFVAVSKCLSKYADFIIVKSNEMSEKVKNKNKATIPNGVNLAMFYPVERQQALKKIGWDPDSRHIVFMSNPDRPEKNSALINSTMKVKEFKNLQLHFLNQIQHNELVYYYNASDVCVLTSFHEGSPNVVKEAMSCSRPVVSTDVGDVRWILGNTEGCYLSSFEPNDLAEKINLALEFSKNNLKTNGRERIVELRLDSESIAGRIIEIYKKVIN